MTNAASTTRIQGCPSTRILLVCIVLVVIPASLAAAPRTDSWQMPLEQYKKMNTFQRAQYDKAAKLFRGGEYKAAAAEFTKFAVQFDDAGCLAYVLLLKGRSLHLAKTRNTAIKVYNDVLDYFREDVDAAAAAMFYKALAQTENGEPAAGLATLRAMVEDKALRKHPLAAGALRRLADHYWAIGQEEQAVRYWKQTVEDFATTNRTEASAARRYVTAWYLRGGQFDAYERWRMDPKRTENAKHRCEVAQYAWSVVYHGYSSPTKRGGKAMTSAEQLRLAKAFSDYWAARRKWFVQAGLLWEYLDDSLSFALRRLGDRQAVDKLADELSVLIAKLPKKAQRDAKYAWLADRMLQGKNVARARYFLGKITDPSLAAYKEYEIRGPYEGDWKGAIAKLLQIESFGTTEWKARAEATRAGVYKDHLRDYGKAIELYRKINQPPGTLWHITDCYIRWGKTKEAMTELTVIKNAFPDQAPRAYWRMAVLMDRAGDKALAIKYGRTVMKAFPSSPESSQAHQLLEKYGIATGGAVIDKD